MSKKKQEIVSEEGAVEEMATVTADSSVTVVAVKTSEEYRAISDETEGWLSEAETNLLSRVAADRAARVAVENDESHVEDGAWVEIGSFHGKSTVLIAAQLALAGHGTLWAVDPHEGVLSYPSAYDENHLLISNEYSEVGSTEEAFLATINKAGLWAHVMLQKSYATDFVPEKPVTFLFIDGLHDFTSVNSDYTHMKQFLVDGAYVLFHDVDEWAGPTLVLKAAVAAGELEILEQAGSLVVCRYIGAK